MKKLPLFLLSTLILLTFAACLSVPNPANPIDDAFDYDTYCTDLDGGNFSVKIDGRNWSTNCVQATYSVANTDDYSQKFLLVYAYNGEGTYFAGSDIEMVWVYRSEITYNGETEVEQGVTFYDGFLNYQQAVGNPNYEPEDFKAYASEDNNPSDMLNITSATTNKVSGNLNFTLTEEESGAEIMISGDFTANIVE